jgi:hypothetical protein
MQSLNKPSPFGGFFLCEDNMKFLTILFTLFTLIGSTAFAVNLRVERRDMKLASQQLIEKQTISGPEVADADQYLDDQASSDSVATTVTSFLAQADVCRNVTVTPGGTTASVPAGDVEVTGTNFFGQVITESITIAENGSSLVSGAKAFCTVTQIVIPVQDGAGATYDIGVGDVLGLKRCMDSAGHVVMAVFDGAYEGTRPTCIADADEIEKNTCDINGTLNGAKDVEIFFIQNFRCLP